MAARRETMTGLALILAALTMAGLVLFGRRDDPDRTRKPRRCRCGYCRTESRLAPWERRIWAVITPGPGQAARIRYGLSQAEYAKRAETGMPMWHPDWLTAELDGYEEELAEMDAETWEAS